MKFFKYNYFLIIGFALIILGFGIEGLGIISHTISHIYSDLTVELIPHIYILGWILVLYGFYKLLKKS